MIKKSTLIIVLAAIVLVLSLSLGVVKSGVLESKTAQEANKKEETNIDSEIKDEETDKEIDIDTKYDKKEKEDGKETDKNSTQNNNSTINADIEVEEPMIKKPISGTINKDDLVSIKKITVDNRCKNTAQALETVYEDKEYIYYLNSISSGCIYVKVNGKEYTLKQAISNSIVTVYELEENGFQFLKKSKNYIEK